ncbi:hypothetical protein [Janthinobacterium sp.]|uniref:hypothetical protein n=1 Tax=Janthinobacterium sp. TaxID=1871054 RepID=UPI00293D1DDF|nr:hypothetical protein [Janthinobacterium sp.]
MVKPEELRVPASITCAYIAEPISFSMVGGLFNVTWTFALGRGPYISEREDEQGTYFRGPPGALFSGRPDKADDAPNILTHMTYDGGFFVPHDHKESPRLYQYFSPNPAAVEVPPADVDCASSAYVSDPKTSGVSIVRFMAEGAVGGAIGGMAARAVAPNSGMGYGRAAGAGALGGAIGMGIVAAIINADIGKIAVYPNPPADAKFAAKLRELADQAVQLKKISPGIAPTAALAVPEVSR